MPSFDGSTPPRDVIPLVISKPYICVFAVLKKDASKATTECNCRSKDTKLMMNPMRLNFAAFALSSFILILSCGDNNTSQLVDDSDVPVPGTHVELDKKKPHLSNSKIDVSSYDVELTFPSFAASEIFAKERINLKLTTPSRDVRLHIDKNSIAIASVKVGNRSAPFHLNTGAPGNHGLAGDVLVIELGQQRALGTILKIELKYKIKVSNKSKFGLTFKPNYQGSPIFETRNWPYYARFWLPSNDHPADSATFKVALHVPPSAVGAANGRLAAGSLEAGEGIQSDGLRLFRWEQSTPIPTYGINVSVGELDIIKNKVCFDTDKISDQFSNCSGAKHQVPLVYYIQKKNDQRKAFLDASNTGSRSMVYFSSLLGLYPYDKLSYITAPHPFNMESVSLIVMISSEATVHEVAHHWWGNTVYIGHWGDLWISEGFATYFAGLYDEFKIGKNTACKKVDGVLNAPAETDPLSIFDNTPYCKGASALADLRTRMTRLSHLDPKSAEGREIFYTLARQLYTDFRFRRLTTAGFHQWLSQNTKKVLAVHGVNASDADISATLNAWSLKWFVQPQQIQFFQWLDRGLSI